MTKKDIIESIASKAGLQKRQASNALEGFIDSVSGALKKGDKVQLVGFGTFEVRKRAARQGRNPQTGAAIKIPASKNVAFRTGKALKDKL